MGFLYVGGMTDYSTEAQVRRINEEFARRRARMLLIFACVEAPVLAAAALAIYVLKLVDPEVGLWIFVAIAVLGGFALTTMILQQARAQQQAIRDVGGATLRGTGPTL